MKADNIKPTGGFVVDMKPNLSVVSEQFVRYFPVTINQGQSMGLLLALTYKDGFTVNSPITN